MKELSYQKVYNGLKESILSGKYQAGEFLPIEPDLEKIYQVSRTTVRKAVKLLVADNMVEVKQGRGTVVLDHKTPQSYNHVTSVTESLRKRGYEVATKSRYVDRIQPPYEIREALRLGAAEDVIRVQRVQTADGVPVCIMTNYIPEHMVPGLEHGEEAFVALYQYLEDQYGIHIAASEDTIFAEGADFETALILGQEVGFPLLHIDRISFDEDGTPVTFDRVRILSNRYKVIISGYGREK